MRRIICIVVIFRIFLLGEVKAEFTDSLRFIIKNPKIVTEGDVNYLDFTISFYRPNANWNENYTILGNTDFYFSFNELAFDPAAAPKIQELNPAIDRSASSSNALSAIARVWWASSRKRLSLKLTYNQNSGLQKLDLPLKDTLDVAVLRWQMAPGNRDPKIQWDMTATGAMTANNIPIIPSFEGEVDKYPKQEINIDETSPAIVWACQGSDVMLFVNARSYFEGSIHYQWQDSRTGGNNDSWRDLETAEGAYSIAADATHPGYDYYVHPGEEGDTLLIRHAPGTVEGLKFRCVVSDPNLPASATKITEEIQLKLRDSLFVFISPASNELTEGMTPVNICPTGDGTNVRLNIMGPQYASMPNIYDIYVNYTFIPDGGIPRPVSDTIRSVDGTNDDGTVMYKTLKVTEPGVYYVNSASTSHCYDAPAHNWQGLSVDTLLSNAQAFGKYDSIQVRYSTDPDTALLDKYFINIGVDTNLMVGLAGNYTVTNLYDATKGDAWIGSVTKRGAPYNDTVYHAQKAGIDSVYYVKNIDGCPQVSMREVEVIDNYYLTLKVFLEGPFLSEEKGMRGVDYQLFPNDGSDLTSPYDDTKIAINKFSIDNVEARYQLPGGIWCDWVYIRLRDEVDGPYVDSLSALLRYDGVICDIEGQPYLSIKNIKNQPYYIVVEHRHHVKVSSAEAITISTTKPSEGVFLVDFTNPSEVLGGSAALKNVSGKYCLIAGDVDGDGYVSTSDEGNIAKMIGNVQYLYDLDQETFVALQDQLYPQNNSGQNSFVP